MPWLILVPVKELLLQKGGRRSVSCSWIACSSWQMWWPPWTHKFFGLHLFSERQEKIPLRFSPIQEHFFAFTSKQFSFFLKWRKGHVSTRSCYLWSVWSAKENPLLPLYSVPDKIVGRGFPFHLTCYIFQNMPLYPHRFSPCSWKLKCARIKTLHQARDCAQNAMHTQVESMDGSGQHKRNSWWSSKDNRAWNLSKPSVSNWIPYQSHY